MAIACVVAQEVGAGAKFTGSGGCAVAFCPEGADQVRGERSRL
jgi:mevalonate kinase